MIQHAEQSTQNNAIGRVFQLFDRVDPNMAPSRESTENVDNDARKDSGLFGVGAVEALAQGNRENDEVSEE